MPNVLFVSDIPKANQKYEIAKFLGNTWKNKQQIREPLNLAILVCTSVIMFRCAFLGIFIIFIHSTVHGTVAQAASSKQQRRTEAMLKFKSIFKFQNQYEMKLCRFLSIVSLFSLCFSNSPSFPKGTE